MPGVLPDLCIPDFPLLPSWQTPKGILKIVHLKELMAYKLLQFTKNVNRNNKGLAEALCFA
jgi:hypothetical protein